MSGSMGASARLAAAHAATLQRCLATNSAAVQLRGRGDAVSSQFSPAPVAPAHRSRTGGRALAAMLRVASAEAPATSFSFLEVSAAAASAQLLADPQPPASPAADAHGQSLAAGTWLAPLLATRHHVAAGSTATGSGAADAVPPAGRVLVTGENCSVGQEMLRSWF